MLKLSCALPCSHPADSKIQVMTGAEAGMLSRPQTGGFWFVIAGQVHFVPGAPWQPRWFISLGKTSGARASPAPCCLYSWCGPTKSRGLGWRCRRAQAVPIAFHSLSCSMCTLLGDAHDLGKAEPTLVCSCHLEALVDIGSHRTIGTLS